MTETISYILEFIDSERFMASSLSNLVNDLAERIHKTMCKYRHNDKTCERCRIKCKNCECYLEHKKVKNNSIDYKCLCCNKNFQSLMKI